MTTTNTTTFEAIAYAAARNKLVSCEGLFEAWRVDHKQAMLVFNLESLIDDLVESYQTLTKVNTIYTYIVLKNPSLYDYELDEGIKGMFQDWLKLTDAVDRDFVSWCKTEGYALAKVDALRDCIANAKIAEAKGFDEEASNLIYRTLPKIENIANVARATSDWPE